MRAAAFALLIGAAIAGGEQEEATPAPHDDAAASDVVEPAMPTHHGHSDEQLDGFGNPMSWEHDPPHGGHGHHDHGGHGRGHGNMHHGKGCFRESPSQFFAGGCRTAVAQGGGLFGDVPGRSEKSG